MEKEKDFYHGNCHDKSLAISPDTDAYASADGFKSGIVPFRYSLLSKQISHLFEIIITGLYEKSIFGTLKEH